MNHHAIRSLVWKELRESASGVALSVFILCGFVGVAFQSRIVPDSAVLAISIMMSLVLSLFFAMWPVASDRRAGTLGMLLALPVQPAVVLAVKASVTGVLLMLPIFASQLMFLVMAGGREVSSIQVLQFGLWTTVASVGTYLWLLCLGVRQSSEARVGMLGLGVMLGGLLLMTLIGRWNAPLAEAMFRCTPTGWLMLLDGGTTNGDLLNAVVGNAVMFVLLGWWATWRFGQLARTRR